MNELVSVIVPIFKAEEYLDECVGSIVNQTYKNLEIILVDDGSPDNCPKMCDDWAKKDSRVRVIHGENIGVASARKNGILSAKGEFICCVDSDDIIDQQLIATVMDIFSSNDVDIVAFGVKCFGLNDNLIPATESDVILDKQTALRKLVLNQIPSYYCNKIFKRQLFSGIDFVDGHLWEDMGAMYSIFLNMENIYLCDKIFYHYRMHSGSIIHSMNEKALEDIFFAQHKRYCDLLKIYPNIAKMALSSVALAAIRLYDRSLWTAVNDASLKAAVEFLNANKNEILRLEGKKRYGWFYRNRFLYDKVRLLRHTAGSLLKKLRKN